MEDVPVFSMPSEGISDPVSLDSGVETDPAVEPSFDGRELLKFQTSRGVLEVAVWVDDTDSSGSPIVMVRWVSGPKFRLVLDVSPAGT